MIAEIRSILEAHGRLDTPIAKLSDTADLPEAGLTSLATVNVMLALEDRFEIEFPDELLTRRTFSSVAAIAAAIGSLRQRAGA